MTIRVWVMRQFIIFGKIFPEVGLTLTYQRRIVIPIAPQGLGASPGLLLRRQ